MEKEEVSIPKSVEIAIVFIVCIAFAFGFSCLHALAFQYLMTTICGLTFSFWKSWWLMFLIRFCVTETGIGKVFAKQIGKDA